jgi:hypothetical protein
MTLISLGAWHHTGISEKGEESGQRETGPEKDFFLEPKAFLPALLRLALTVMSLDRLWSLLSRKGDN